MNNKLVQPSWTRVFLVLVLAMILFALVHELAVPVWAHMVLQIGIMLLTYILALVDYQLPETASLEDKKEEDRVHERFIFHRDSEDEQTQWDRKTTDWSLKGRLS